jgi:transposase InsO family protein
VSRATIDRTLRRQGLVTPAPGKRPRSSYIRFAAEQPNEMWQTDFTHYPLTTGDDAEILSWLDVQPDQPATIADLQVLVDRFAELYNTARPHRSSTNAIESMIEICRDQASNAPARQVNRSRSWPRGMMATQTLASETP